MSVAQTSVLLFAVGWATPVKAGAGTARVSVLPPEGLTIVEYGQAVLYCAVGPEISSVGPGGGGGGDSAGLTFRWERGGIPVHRDHSKSKPALIIEEATERDAGRYTCMVTTPDGSRFVSANPVNVTVLFKPRIVHQPERYTRLSPGNSLILKVAVVAVPEPKLHWEKDGNLIVGADGEVLVIDDISGADAGSYAAVISNSCLGDSAEQNQCVRRSDDAVVQINSPPRIIDQPVNITLDPGQRLRLVAAFAGLPFPELQWQKDGVLLPSETSPQLVVHSVMESDEGSYVVSASNDLGAVYSTAAHVAINDPPFFTSVSDPTTKVLFGDRIVLKTVAMGVPPPKFSWLKNGARINGATNQTLELPSSSSEDEGNYTVVAENSAGITTSPIMRVVVLVPPTIKLTTVAPLSAIVGEMIAMEVHVEGNPRPDVHWKINGVLIPGESSHYIKFIPTESMLGDLQITAVATSEAGNAKLEFPSIDIGLSTSVTSTATTTMSSVPDMQKHGALKEQRNPPIIVPASPASPGTREDTKGFESGTGSSGESGNSDALPAIISVIILLIVVAVGIMFVIHRRRRAPQKPEAIGVESDDLAHQAAADAVMQQHMRHMQDHLQGFFAESETDGGGIHQTYSLASMVKVVPRQINPHDIRILDRIGAGQFGDVHRGELACRHASATTVAIKMMKKSNPTDDDVKEFMAEAALMAQFDHPNILRLVGVAATGETLMLVTELATRGSLDKFLQSEETTEVLQLRMAIDVVAGMQYLENCGFIHRDLAARNVLLNSSFECRICDFGLSRKCGVEGSHWEEDGMVAIRWTAPEVLKNNRYTRKTDVWSFGVLLWELWSKASLPYGRGWNNVRVVTEVNSGYRLERPSDCTQEIYVMMMSCWHPEPKLRPPFSKIKAGLTATFNDWQLRGEFAMDMKRLNDLYAASNQLPLKITAVSELEISTISEHDSVAALNSSIATRERIARLERVSPYLDGVPSPVVAPRSPTKGSCPRGNISPARAAIMPSTTHLSPWAKSSPMSVGSPLGKPTPMRVGLAALSTASQLPSGPTAYDVRGSQMVEEPEEAWDNLDPETQEQGVGIFTRFSRRFRESFKAFSFKKKRKSAVITARGSEPDIEPSYLVPTLIRGGQRSGSCGSGECAELPPAAVNLLSNRISPQPGALMATVESNTGSSTSLEPEIYVPRALDVPRTQSISPYKEFDEKQSMDLMGQIEALEAGVLQKLSRAQQNRGASTTPVESNLGLSESISGASELNEKETIDLYCNSECITSKIAPGNITTGGETNIDRPGSVIMMPEIAPKLRKVVPKEKSAQNPLAVITPPIRRTVRSCPEVIVLPSGENIRKHVAPMVDSWEQTADETRRKNSQNIINLQEQSEPVPTPRKRRLPTQRVSKENGSDSSSCGYTAGEENVEPSASIGSPAVLSESFLGRCGSPLDVLSPTVTNEMDGLAAGHRGTTLLQYSSKRAAKPAKKHALEEGPSNRRRRKKIVEKFDPDRTKREHAAQEAILDVVARLERPDQAKSIEMVLDEAQFELSEPLEKTEIHRNLLDPSVAPPNRTSMYL